MFNSHALRLKQLVFSGHSVLYSVSSQKDQKPPAHSAQTAESLRYCKDGHVAPNTATGTIPVMTMPTKIGDTTFFSIEEAGRVMGCTPSWVRQLCRAGKLEGALRHGQRSWLVPEKAAKDAGEQLTSRAIGKKPKK